LTTDRLVIKPTFVSGYDIHGVDCLSRELIRKYYDEQAQIEWRRLVQDPYHQLEFHTTLFFLEKYLPSEGLILDAGGGLGRYTIELGKRGYEVILFDLSPESLKKARRQIRRAKVHNNVIQMIEGSITDLSVFEDDNFDAVLCLGGPLGHIQSKTHQDKAVDEFIRVAKIGAPIFISVIGRLGLFKIALESFPEQLRLKDLYLEILETGNYEGGHGFTVAHFFLSEELESMFKNKPVTILEMVGLEGLASTHRRKLNQMARKHKKSWENWQEYHYKTCTHPHVVGTSEHILLICQKS
jgi:ubiquinone/menaquinone biosynthesis C-methylase UbiE